MMEERIYHNYIQSRGGYIEPKRPKIILSDNFLSVGPNTKFHQNSLMKYVDGQFDIPFMCSLRVLRSNNA
jgi:hypothetical protein